jgi:hypothetical protein
MPPRHGMSHRRERPAHPQAGVHQDPVPAVVSRPIVISWTVAHG